MALGESADILLRIKADSSQGSAEIVKFKKELGDIEKESKGAATGVERIAAVSGISAEKFAALGAAAASYGAVLAGLATFTAGFVTTLYKLAESASEFGSSIYDASLKTGLGAESLSALKFAADQSGSSFEQVTKGITNFGVEIGKAAVGNEQAAAKMKALGVTSTDLDTALNQVFKTIIEGKTDTDKLALASEAFGKKIGPDLIPLIKDANGNFAEMRQRAKDLGVTITDEAMVAADRFGDQVDLLSAQLAGIGRTIGTEVMPVFTEMAGDISEWVNRNKGEVSSWAKAWSSSLREIFNTFSNIKSIFDSGTWQERIFYLMGVLFPNSAQGIGLQALNNSKDPNKRSITSVADLRQLDDTNNIRTLPTSPAFRGGGSRGSNKAQSEAEQRAKAELQAQIGIERDKLKDTEAIYIAALEKLREEFKKTGDAAAFVDASTAALARLAEEAGQILPLLTDLENQQAAGGTGNQLELLRRNQEERSSELQARMNESVDNTNKLIIDSTKKSADQILKIDLDLEKNREEIDKRRLDRFRKQTQDYYDEEIKAGRNVLQNIVDVTAFLYGQADEDYKLLLEKNAREKEERKKKIDEEVKDHAEKLRLLKKLDEDFRQEDLDAYEEHQEKKKGIDEKYPAPATKEKDRGPGFGDTLQDALGIEIPLFDPAITDQVAAQADLLKGVYADLAQSTAQSLGVMAQGLANMLTQWIITGKFSAKAALQMAAGVAIGLAIQAGMKALFNLAEGLAALANPFTAWMAPGYFAAAKAYAVVAAVAGGVGVALAAGARAAGGGNQNARSSFQQNTSSTTRDNRDTSGQGQAYSGQKGVIMEGGINQAMPTQKVEVLVRLDSNGVLQVMQDDVANNGKMRGLILNVVNG